MDVDSSFPVCLMDPLQQSEGGGQNQIENLAIISPLCPQWAARLLYVQIHRELPSETAMLQGLPRETSGPPGECEQIQE